jgi:hypothetical protein
LRFTHFFIFIFLFNSLISNEASCQVLVDLKTRSVEDGLRDRLVTNIVRDKFGFFYLTSESNLQKYDGENFTDVDFKKMVDGKINPSDVLSMVNIYGDIYLSTIESTDLYFIKAASNIVDVIKLDKLSKAFFVDNKIYLSSKFENKYEIAILDPESKKPKPLFYTPTLPINILQKNGQIYYQDEAALYKLEKGAPKLVIYFKGKIMATKNYFCLANDQYCQILNDQKSLKTIHQVLNPFSKLKLIKKDNADNILLTYTSEQDYTNNAILVTKDSVYNLDDVVISLDNKFIDAYSEDFRNKIMTVGHQGIYIFTFLQDGASQIYKAKGYIKTFGHIITGIAGNGKGEVLFLSEEKGIFEVKNDKENEIFINSVKFFGNGKIYFNKRNNKYYNYSDQYLNPSLINEVDLINNKVESVNINLRIVDLVFEGNTLYLTGKNTTTHLGEILALNLDNLKSPPRKVFNCTNFINGIFFHKNTIWIYTVKGILVCDKNFNIIKTLDRYQTDKDFHIDFDVIRDIKFYNNKIIAGTLGGGIYIIDPSTFKVLGSLDQKDGLTDNKVIGILEDNQGNCWLPTWNGLNVINKDFKVIKTIYQYQGLSDKELNTKSYYKDDFGTLYFGTINGIFKIDPVKVLKWKLTHGLYLKNAISFGDKTEYLVNTSFYNNIKSLKLEFIAPDYFNYRFDVPTINIEGLDKNKWQYEKLNASIINPKNESKKIEITSPYTDYTYAVDLKITPNFSLYLKSLAILGFFSFIGYFIIKRIEKNEAEKTANNKKIIGLELSALQGQMNPHFIFNSLGAIQYFIQTHDAEKADDYLSNFAKLMRMILESSKSRYITIRDELQLLDLYIGLEHIRFEEKFSYELKIDEDLDLEFKIPPMIVQPYIENAINHGIVNLKNKLGKLIISVNNIDQDTIQMIISDNGIGRDEAQKLVNKTHKSRGMQIVKERIQSFNTSDNFHVSSDIDDLYNEDGTAKGTQITLIFKDNS